MKKELFISEDLRTLQNKIKNDKSAEGLVMRPGEYPKIQLPNPKLPPMKTSEKMFAEKTAEKVIAEKTSEKMLAEKQNEGQLSPGAWQNIVGVVHTHNDENRLF